MNPTLTSRHVAVGAHRVAWLPVCSLAVLLIGCQEPTDYRFGGYVEAESIEVGSRVGGRVAEVAVEEGDSVAAGKLLVRFESEHLEAELAEAQHHVETLRTTLEKLLAGPRKQEIEIARQQLAAATERAKNADIDYKRALEAGARNITREVLDDLQTAVRVTRAELQTRQQELNVLEEGTRAEDIKIARHQLEEAESRVTRLRVQLDESCVEAPMGAIVEVIDLEPGDLVAGGAPLATLVRRDELWVRCFVPATLLTLVSPGDRVQVMVDSRSRRYRGKVLRVNRVAEYTPRNVQTYEQRQDQVFAVKVRILDPRGELRPGMAATMVIPRPPAAEGPRD